MATLGEKCQIMDTKQKLVQHSFNKASQFKTEMHQPKQKLNVPEHLYKGSFTTLPNIILEYCLNGPVK